LPGRTAKPLSLRPIDHALTSLRDPIALTRKTGEWRSIPLACGIETAEKAALFFQSEWCRGGTDRWILSNRNASPHWSWR